MKKTSDYKRKSLKTKDLIIEFLDFLRIRNF